MNKSANKLKMNETGKIAIAKLISNITYPPLLAIPIFILLNLLLLNYSEFIIIESICLIFSTILPILAIILWSKYKEANKKFPIEKSRKYLLSITKVDNDFTIKENRNYPLIIIVLIYFIGSIILWALNAPPLVIILMFCYGSNTLAVFLINLKWKISIHSVGIAGPTVALIFGFGLIGSLLGLLSPFIMWSRVILKRHTLLQVLAGFSLGLILTFLQMQFLLNNYL